MFHHFKDEVDIGENYLIASVGFTYSGHDGPDHRPVYNFVSAISTSGYRIRNGEMISRSSPPVEFEYSQPKLSDVLEIADPQTLQNLPSGMSGAQT